MRSRENNYKGRLLAGGLSTGFASSFFPCLLRLY
jgi:hypothetical protein